MWVLPNQELIIGKVWEWLGTSSTRTAQILCEERGTRDLQVRTLRRVKRGDFVMAIDKETGEVLAGVDLETRKGWKK